MTTPEFYWSHSIIGIYHHKAENPELMEECLSGIYILNMKQWDSESREFASGKPETFKDKR